MDNGGTPFIYPFKILVILRYFIKRFSTSSLSIILNPSFLKIITPQLPTVKQYLKEKIKVDYSIDLQEDTLLKVLNAGYFSSIAKINTNTPELIELLSKQLNTEYQDHLLKLNNLIEERDNVLKTQSSSFIWSHPYITLGLIFGSILFVCWYTGVAISVKDFLNENYKALEGNTTQAANFVAFSKMASESLLTHFLDFIEDETVLKLFQFYVSAHGMLPEVKFPSPSGYTITMAYNTPNRKRYTYRNKGKNYSFYLWDYLGGN